MIEEQLKKGKEIAEKISITKNYIESFGGRINNVSINGSEENGYNFNINLSYGIVEGTRTIKKVDGLHYEKLMFNAKLIADNYIENMLSLLEKQLKLLEKEFEEI